MKLSELVNFRNELGKLSVIQTQQSAETDIHKITHLISTSAITSDLTEQFQNSHLSLRQAFILFEQQLNELKANIQQQIEQEERPYFQESYRLYDKEMIFETSEYILNRRMFISNESLEFINSRLTRYATWKHAGMIIRPGRETFIKNMVMFDPLYLVDQDYDLLTPAISDFHSDYQRRDRKSTRLNSSHSQQSRMPSSA